jgi:predicted component of type VI protein secretion system
MTAQRLFQRLWLKVLLLCCALALMGCGATKPPTSTLSQAELAVKQANDSNAAAHAALELQMAREQLDEARQAMQDSDYDKARREAEKALVNAQLAEAKAETASARQTVDELRKSIESLRHEAMRRSTP